MWILYYKSSNDDIDEALISRWLEQLPAAKRQSLQRRRQGDKQQLSLIGWQLLRYGMQLAGNASFDLQQLQFPEHGKPFVTGGWDFNISHSGNIVACAISQNGRIGIDVERHRDVEPQRFKRYFSDNELAWMGNNANRFIELWTQKEAVIKASGIGLKGLSQVITHDHLSASDAHGEWSLHKLDLDKDYSAHIAIDTETSIQHLEQINIKQLCED